jgi:hypothetical protein
LDERVNKISLKGNIPSPKQTNPQTKHITWNQSHKQTFNSQTNHEFGSSKHHSQIITEQASLANCLVLER